MDSKAAESRGGLDADPGHARAGAADFLSDLEGSGVKSRGSYWAFGEEAAAPPISLPWYSGGGQGGLDLPRLLAQHNLHAGSARS